jgi:PIN domain nuclease of toxin-antitoxin system
VRVLADTHALYWYLISPDRLSPRSLEVLGQAEDSDGIAVSALTIPELWVSVSRKRGDRAIPRSGYEIVRSALLDPETALDVAPLDASAWRHFEALPASISDPTDGLIVSNTQALGVPLVTKDGRITAARVVEVIW